jgi:hypothetical protein
MHHSKLRTEGAAYADPQVRVSRLDGSEVPVRLRLLGYESCEFDSDQVFDPGEQISIQFYRMGSIRARVVSCQETIVEAEFVKDCPV